MWVLGASALNHCAIFPATPIAFSYSPSSHFFLIPDISESMLIMHCIFKCVFHIFFFKKACGVCLFESGLSHLPWWSPTAPIFLQMIFHLGRGCFCFAFWIFLFVWDEVSCSPGCPWTGLVAEDGPGLLGLRSPTSLVLGSQTRTATPSLCRAGGSQHWGCSQLVECLPSMRGALVMISSI